ncbi:hypothetical protein AVEN_266121-1 [Araneus ventricosus]|uniref:Uncharacterized protein n=1 Tax=Araneus ventricosus TaxID=182803 RepID=A0A4Y2GAP4_ARAVE|nr:hypothetical protein AVEN_266121-1 [Araneus ventricosus]
MITAERIAVLVMLPWLRAVFQLLVFGRLCYVIYMIPYLLLIKNIEKESAQKKTKRTNVDVEDFTLMAIKDASTSTDEIDLSNNKTSDEKIDKNIENRRNYILASHPFLEKIENFGAHGIHLALLISKICVIRTCFPLTQSFKTVETIYF